MQGKVKEKYYSDYLVLLFILGIITLVLFVYAVMHPRLQNIAIALFMGLITFLDSGWMNRNKFANPTEYEKAVKEYKKKLATAKKQGIELTESKPEKPKKMAPKLVAIFFGTLIGTWMLYIMTSFLGMIFPKHMPYEYKGEIAKFKENSYYDRSFFPDAIPKGAKDVEWYVLPSMLQGGGTEVLIFTAPEDYIQSTIQTYTNEATICQVENDMYFQSFYDKDRLDKLVVYKLYDNDDWNHVHMWGIFVDQEINKIGFFCE